MSLLRGWVRIGGFDIRLVLQRDSSLYNVEGDTRFIQKAGGNPETTIGRFQSYINEAEGFARKARFYVEFNLPRVEDSPSTGGPTLNGFARQGAEDILIQDINLSTAAE